MKKSKIQLKIWQSTKKRKQELKANNQRAAWNRIGKRFGLSQELIKEAKRINISPFPILRNESISADSIIFYIQTGNLFEEKSSESLAEYGVALEIARLEKESDSGNNEYFEDIFNF